MRTFLRGASVVGMGLGLVFFTIGLAVLVVNRDGALAASVGFGSMVSSAVIWLLVDIANAIDDVARIRQVTNINPPVEQGPRRSIGGRPAA